MSLRLKSRRRRQRSVGSATTWRSNRKRAGKIIMAFSFNIRAPFVILSQSGHSLNLAFPRTAKMQVHKQGKKRSLVIRKCEVDDSARITARTNVEETGTIFMVKCKLQMEGKIFESIQDGAIDPYACHEKKIWYIVLS